MDSVEEKVCAECGAVLPGCWFSRGTPRLYCGNACAARAYRRAKVKRHVKALGGPWPCLQCGEAKVWRKNGKFCGTSCSAKFKAAGIRKLRPEQLAAEEARQARHAATKKHPRGEVTRCVVCDARLDPDSCAQVCGTVCRNKISWARRSSRNGEDAREVALAEASLKALKAERAAERLNGRSRVWRAGSLAEAEAMVGPSFGATSPAVLREEGLTGYAKAMRQAGAVVE